ncbi:MAG TPA: glycosyltransferase family A protein, partial [Ktedonobacteraceae bacterium]|nr:glycosyltransferase family A protein [Ktedonobacteraceae bacterium]
MQRPKATFLDRLSYGLTALFALDRLLKLIAAWHFFRRPLPPTPQPWPTVSLLQPITRGTSDLLNALRARTKLDYPATIQHVLICDASDEESQAIVSSFLNEFPSLQVKVILVPPQDTFATSDTSDTTATSVVTKIKKRQAALPFATGEVFCFVDDDVSLRPHSLNVLL